MSKFPIILIPNAICQLKDVKKRIVTIVNIPIPKQPDDKPEKIDKTLILLQIVALAFANGIVYKFVQFPIIILIVEIILMSIYYLKIVLAKRKEIKEYEEKYAKYVKQKKRYENRRKYKRLDKEEKIQSKNEKILEILQRTQTYDGYLSNNPQGYSEKAFQKFLLEYFPDKIYTRLELIIPSSIHRYHPDFAYIDKETNLHIDIEIDEPYAFKNKQPTHYINSDNQRNVFFLRKGWIIIRFSEKQVIMNTRSCCKTIAQVVSSIVDDKDILKQFAGVPNLKKERQWTMNEAKQMAKKDYRNQYLLKEK